MGLQDTPLTTRSPPPGDAPRRIRNPPGCWRVQGPAGVWGPRPAAMKLTRKMVLSRAKASELHSVRKLNCW